MISVSQLGVQFGGTELFSNVSFLVNERDRIGLVGKNGAGKSTLMKILSGTQQASNGNVALPKGTRIGYLPQEIMNNSTKSIWDETLTAFSEVLSFKNRLTELENKLHDPSAPEESIHRWIEEMGNLQLRLDVMDAGQTDARTEKILLGLGFERTDFSRPLNEFSGGWRMRVELAKLLLQRPDLLLMDEPTNHLDIESIEWLEEFLRQYEGAVIVVSHDVAFLDNLTTRTLEINSGKVYDYKTNYTGYIDLKNQRLEQQENQQKNQQKYIEHTEELINKFRAKKNKAAFAQSLIKKLEKLERVEVDEDDTASILFKFPEASASGKVPVLCEQLIKRYGEKTVLNGVDMEIERGLKVAFVGRNGEGKTTLSKIIAGKESHEGKLTLGHNVIQGYYAQNQSEGLDENKTVLETIDDVAVGDIRKNIRGLLGAFLFRGDEVEKKVKVLSGGEKARLALCKLLLQPTNMLVLDEPTNHLDVRSKNQLKAALMQYEGTVIVVSHDRDFLDGLADRVFEFRGGKVKQHLCGVTEFLAGKRMSALSELEKRSDARGKDDKVSESKLSYEQKKELEKEQRRKQNQLKKCEEEIARLEKEIAEKDALLADPESFARVSGDPKFFAEYDKLKKDHENKLEEWMSLQEN